jgi:transcriptional regulator with XRE-family HTH domain
MDITDIQKRILKQIDKKRNDKVMAVVVAEALDISEDAAYRRLKGRTKLSFEDIFKLCEKFELSLDEIFGRSGNVITFTRSMVEFSENSIRDYFKLFSEKILAFSNADVKKIFYLSEDIPQYHYLPYYELYALRFYQYWLNLGNERIGFEDFMELCESKDEIINSRNSIARNFGKISVTEIWTNSTIKLLLQLIDYYRYMNLIKEKSTLETLYNQLLDIINGKNADD